jgi:phosphoribosylamine--glycine ligase
VKALIVGSGGREHALAWKIRQSPRLAELYCAPGNAGTAAIAQNIQSQPIIWTACSTSRFPIALILPWSVWKPLVAGIVDNFRRLGRWPLG